jgi:hypothetical protein
VLAQVKQDREVLRQERDGWRREAKKLYYYAASFTEVDERRFAPPEVEQSSWWRRLAG